jgi:type VI secretion system protein ImpC
MRKTELKSPGKIQVSLIADDDEEKVPIPQTDQPFRIVILGDFSGRQNRGLFQKGPDLSKQRFLAIDRDNFDEVMARLGVELHLSVAGKGHQSVSVRFHELDDFHPDRLFEQVSVFQSLTGMTQNLDTSWLPAKARKETHQPTEPIESDFSKLTQGSLLEEMLEETEKKPKPSEWDRFLRKVVEPHQVPDIDAQQAELVASVSAISSKLMAAILHFPDFQTLEAGWRGLYFLISRLEAENEIQIYLFDISKNELAADLIGAKTLRSTGIYRSLIERAGETYGEKPWAVLAGNFTFDHTVEDGELLRQLGRVAQELDAPFISGASSHLLNCESLAETPDPDRWKRKTDKKTKQAWESLRKSREASHLGLVLPRFLLRLPYGRSTSPIDAFDFEEMDSEPKHEHYLWGNPCFACLLLLTQAFIHDGWNLRPGFIQQIDDGLPVHVYWIEGEPRMKSCNEVLLTERATDMILEKGLMPFISFQDKLRLVRFQSLADPPTSLAGQWK